MGLSFAAKRIVRLYHADLAAVTRRPATPRALENRRAAPRTIDPIDGFC